MQRPPAPGSAQAQPRQVQPQAGPMLLRARPGATVKGGAHFLPKRPPFLAAGLVVVVPAFLVVVVPAFLAGADTCGGRG